MNVCVIGGGNIGTALSAELSYLNPDMSVRLLTSKPNLFNREIEVFDEERDESFFGRLDIISDDPKLTVSNADLILVTTPSFLIDRVFNDIKTYVKKEAFLGVVPGSGGSEFYWKKYFNNECILFGFERVPYITRLYEYGKSVHMRSRKSHITIASLPINRSEVICEMLSQICHVRCINAANYLTISLTPSNPVLHTSRIYDLFKGATSQSHFKNRIEFYSDWTDHASKIMLEIDAELQNLCKALYPMDMRGVTSLKKHYESETASELTQKIRSIPSFKGIYAPLIQTDSNDYMIDVDARFFIEDFPFGLCIIRGFCEIFDVRSPVIDKVLMWFQKFMGVEYIINGNFIGRDIINTAAPQNFGIETKEDVLEFYRVH